MSAVVLDRHGEIDAKVWDYAGPINDTDAGEIIWLQGSVTTYKGSHQLKIERLRLADESDSFDISELVPAAPIDPAAMLEDVRALINSIEDPDYRSVALELLGRHENVISEHPRRKERPPQLPQRASDAHWQYDEAGGFSGGSVWRYRGPKPAASRNLCS